MIIHHFVPEYRLDKNYYRRWLFGVGISRALADEHFRPVEEKKLLRVPRWMYLTATKDCIKKIKFTVSRKETESLDAENSPLTFAGYFYEKNLRGGVLDKPLKSVFGKLFSSHDR